jgi:predicted GNAT family acetyltransferase
MTLDVHHDPHAGRFQADVDGHRAVLDYRLDGAVLSILHTGVPDAIGGRGIAAELTRAALQLARTQGWTVRPLCSYAAGFMQRHPEFADLVAP